MSSHPSSFGLKTRVPGRKGLEERASRFQGCTSCNLETVIDDDGFRLQLKVYSISISFYLYTCYLFVYQSIAPRIGRTRKDIGQCPVKGRNN